MIGVALCPWYLFVLRRPSPGVYGLYGRVNGKLQEDLWPGGSFQCPHPCGAPLLTHASTEGPPTLAGSFGSVSCGVTAPLRWVLMQAKFCLCPPTLESLFPSVLWKSYNQIPLACKVRYLGDFQSLCCIPRLGSLVCGSEPSQQCENFFDLMVLQSVGHPPSGRGI